MRLNEVPPETKIHVQAAQARRNNCHAGKPGDPRCGPRTAQELSWEVQVVSGDLGYKDTKFASRSKIIAKMHCF